MIQSRVNVRDHKFEVDPPYAPKRKHENETWKPWK